VNVLGATAAVPAVLIVMNVSQINAFDAVWNSRVRSSRLFI
jgi:hypothetical protein